MKRKIGSEFFLNIYGDLYDKRLSLDYLHVNINDTVFLSTASSAISFVLDQIKLSEDEKIVLLPSFISSDLVKPFIKDGYQIHYYHVNIDLTCDRKSFLGNLENVKPNVIFLHEYFGFNTLIDIMDVIENIKMTGVTVIDDITHSLYSKIKHVEADYYVFSFTQWAGLPDGACAVNVKKTFSFKPFAIDNALQIKRLEALYVKYLYVEEGRGSRERFLRLFDEANQLICSQKTIYAMSPISKTIQANIDIDYLREARRKNYELLLEDLSKSDIVEPVFEKLKDDIVPMFFALYVKCNRQDLLHYLEKNDVYASALWSKPKYCEEHLDYQAEFLYEYILALPCDQRYNADDMKRLVELINEYEALLNK